MNDYKTRLQSALIEQHKKWFDYDRKALKHEIAEFIECPVCGSNDNRVIFDKDWFTYARCRKCRMVFLNPRLSIEATYEFYNSSWNATYNEEKFNTVSESTRTDDKVNFENLRLLEKYNQNHFGKTLVEIGIGKGYFLQKAKEAGYSVYGVELNRNNCDNARRLVGDTVYNVDLHDAKFPADMFDVIYMKDVFEHVPDPKKLLKEIHRIGKKDALLFIEVPNIDGLIYKIVQERHVCIFGFEHLNYWSPKTLSAILRATGFEVVAEYHESLDCTVQRIASHFAYSLPNCVHAKSVHPFAKGIAKLIQRGFSRQPFRFFDQIITPSLANLIRSGSVIKIIAKKI